MKRLITIRLSDEMLTAIDEKAKADGINRTELIEKAVTVYTNPTTVGSKAKAVYTDVVTLTTDPNWEQNVLRRAAAVKQPKADKKSGKLLPHKVW